MINKKFLLVVVAGLITCSVACAAPTKFSVEADELDYDMQSGVAVGKGHVVLIQDDAKATGETATYNSKTKSGTLKGNVVGTRGEDGVKCDEFHIENDDKYSAMGNAELTKQGKKLFAPRVDYGKTSQYAETFGNWARLTDVDGSVMNAVKIVYDGKTGIATATGGVTVHSDARKLDAYGDKAIYDTSKSGYVELIGNAEATQDGNHVKGAKLRLTNANVAIGDGNVTVKYIPQKKAQMTTSAAKTEQQALASKEPAVVNKETNAEA